MFESLGHANISMGGLFRRAGGSAESQNACAMLILIGAVLLGVYVGWLYRNEICGHKNDLMMRMKRGSEHLRNTKKSPLELTLNEQFSQTRVFKNAVDSSGRYGPQGIGGSNVAGLGEKFTQKKR
jgi:hypothetical protein